jgi:hypothetical protein
VSQKRAAVCRHCPQKRRRCHQKMMQCLPRWKPWVTRKDGRRARTGARKLMQGAVVVATRPTRDTGLPPGRGGKDAMERRESAQAGTGTLRQESPGPGTAGGVAATATAAGSGVAAASGIARGTGTVCATAAATGTLTGTLTGSSGGLLRGGTTAATATATGMTTGIGRGSGTIPATTTSVTALAAAATGTGTGTGMIAGVEVPRWCASMRQLRWYERAPECALLRGCSQKSVRRVCHVEWRHPERAASQAWPKATCNDDVATWWLLHLCTRNHLDLAPLHSVLAHRTPACFKCDHMPHRCGLCGAPSTTPLHTWEEQALAFCAAERAYFHLSTPARTKYHCHCCSDALHRCRWHVHARGEHSLCLRRCVRAPSFLFPTSEIFRASGADALMGPLRRGILLADAPPRGGLHRPNFGGLAPHVARFPVAHNLAFFQAHARLVTDMPFLSVERYGLEVLSMSHRDSARYRAGTAACIWCMHSVSIVAMNRTELGHEQRKSETATIYWSGMDYH